MTDTTASAEGGASIVGGQKYCSGCATVLHKDAAQCPKCGAPQAGAAAAGSKSKIAAVLFALLLGGLGAHKFYLGRPVWGVLYILFCWTFIPSVVSLIEGIVYATMSDAAFTRKYG
ncbi:TM2 domain-containing protein [Brevundimonas sp.]|uniref:TM2 domain-containing protein n=1 Tax=Brevundimonas sp. TaxID=1871086 RepID=UPI002ED9FC45